MKKLLWLNATLLLGTSGALLWILGMIWRYDNILLGEPNWVILYAELWGITLCLFVALRALLYLVRKS